MDKYLNTIQICIKANKISYGETMLYDIKGNKVFLVLIAKDAGVSQAKKIKDKCNFYNVKYLDNLLTKDDLKLAMQKEVSALGIKDSNLAKKFIENLNEKEDYYGKQ